MEHVSSYTTEEPSNYTTYESKPYPPLTFSALETLGFSFLKEHLSFASPCCDKGLNIQPKGARRKDEARGES